MVLASLGLTSKGRVYDGAGRRLRGSLGTCPELRAGNEAAGDLAREAQR